MKLTIACLASFFTLLCGATSVANISGRIMDGSNGVPLVGATVTLQNAGLVVTTDDAGRYSFEGKVAATGATKATPADVVTFIKDGYGSISRNVESTGGTENVVLTLEGKVTYVCSTADAKGRWQIARTVYDPDTKTSEITYLTDTTQWNFKPNFSPDGSKMTFFRRYVTKGPLETWLSAICVMNADGSGLHEITAREESFNTEPYWTRDGSMRISFNRMYVENRGPYWSDADGQPGAEHRIGPWGWVNPHLADGRVFMQRGGDSYLATPDGNGNASYVKVQRSDNKHIHKIALSQDETMIAYQKWVDPNHNTYNGGVMVYAKFDASVPSITNEVIFDELDPSTKAWYDGEVVEVAA